MVFPLPTPMRIALDAAITAANEGEVPVGAVITRADEVIAVTANATRTTNDPTAHAEIVAIRAACAKLGTDRLIGCTLWVSLEPCAMCAGAIAHARIERLYYAASDPKGGGVEHGARVFSHSTCHHRPEVISGLGEREAADLLRDFFLERRDR
jgi:tRNA(adenine34) deaminase